MIFFQILLVETEGIIPTGVMTSLAERVRKLITDSKRITGNLPGITCAASLAHHKLPLSMQTLYLKNVDLTSVPDEHLASLLSSVGTNVNIRNVNDCGLVTLLNFVKCKGLTLSQSLGSEETRALVQAMESRVEVVCFDEFVTMDIRELIQYNAMGWGNAKRLIFVARIVITGSS